MCMFPQSQCWNVLCVYGVISRKRKKKEEEEAFSFEFVDSAPGPLPGSPHLWVSWSALPSGIRGLFLSQAWWPCGSELHSVVSEPSPTSCFPQCNSRAVRDKGQTILHYKQSLPVGAQDIYNDKTRHSWQISHLARTLCVSGSWGNESRTHRNPVVNKFLIDWSEYMQAIITIIMKMCTWVMCSCGWHQLN